ncbi:metalloendopeptidase OMA1, mitochondrial-like [Pollicipes pollicipes]|uniref:metalloendopeptidase OMA1, mitochondrial-like n=1 Tax=Pollicipes pollicipes TaxID=41117 RepID=UPI0018854207|nr:metalloendopeptidase OMA1, mitochondrial-like [Pollicipes pollicipes]XP_037070003.1 metalloendopeptidase OMA1, mitochondrial-like [Pollicipes pollicipes]XP_037070004.1 metalloendopeptidase OMA1, mitochondrial-like [Pollicipes pollicipes]
MLCSARALARRAGVLGSSQARWAGPTQRCARLQARPCQGFSTSSSRPAPLPPVVWLVLRPISKFMAVLFGRAYRKWWRALPHDKRAVFKESVQRNRKRIIVVSTAVAGLSLHYYVSHLQTTPVTGRTRFVAFTPEQFDKISQEGFDQMIEEHGASVLPAGHEAYDAVVRVANRLLAANADLDEVHDKDWSVTVVDDEDLVNAYVLPCGKIFVFTGMLEFCTSDDQLGCVLGHEMAHSLLGHGGERFSRAHLIDLMLILPLAAIWAFLPNDGISAFAHWFFRTTVGLLADMPHSRELETEADEVGLRLAAKGCFDVREASAFWAKMALRREMEDGVSPEWLSTHPADEARRESIDRQVPDLQRTRDLCQCAPLPDRDPRAEFEQFRQRLLEEKAAARALMATPLTKPDAARSGG